MDNNAKPATSIPVTAPDLKATSSPLTKPFLEASAVLTLAWTDTSIPTYPAIPDNVAPIKYPRPTKILKEKLIIIKTTTPTIAIVLYCLFKYAFAPTWIADAISRILLLPELAFRIDLPVKNP